MNFRLRTFSIVACLLVGLAVSAAEQQVPLPIYNPAPEPSSPASFVQVGTKVFFTATMPATGRELWVTDGTPAGTSMVTELAAGPASSSIGSMVEFKGFLYFMVAGGELWRTNGTSAGTMLIKKLDLSSVRLINAGTLLYLATGHGSYSASQLWVSDGTAARTLRVRSFWQSIDAPFGFEGKLFFSTMEDTLLGRQIWVSDGTLFGTRILGAGSVCPQNGCWSYAEPPRFFRLGARLLFTGLSTHHEPADLWVTNGTDAGTQRIAADTGGLLASSGTLAFFSTAGKLTRTDGTAAGTSLIKELPMRIQSGSVAGGTLFFAAGDYARELWKSDGTAAGTQRVTEMSPAGYGGVAGVGAGTRYIFWHYDSAGAEPWSSDGTAAGTAVIDTVPGPDGISPENLFSAGGYVLFSGARSPEGRELWRTDGTAAGTFLLKNIAPERVTGQIEGTIRDGATAAPVPNATVTVYDLVGRMLTSVASGADGKYQIPKLTTDGYYLRALSPTHVPQVYPNHDCNSCWPTSRQAVNVTAGMATTGVDFNLTAGGRMTGVITHLGSPVSGASVYIYSGDRVATTVRTIPNGSYSTPHGLLAGTYHVVAIPEGPSPAVGVIYGGTPCATGDPYYVQPCNPYPTGKPISLSAGKVTTGIDIALATKPRISGRVTDRTGNPIAGISIGVYYGTSGAETYASTVTNANGEYLTGPLYSDEYLLVARGASKRYVSQVYHAQNCANTCDPLSGRPVAVEVDRPATGIDFTLHPVAAVIRGTIKDALTGQRVSVPILLYNTAGQVVDVDGNDHWSDPVDAEGRFELRNVPPGTYYLLTGTRLYDGIDCKDDCDVKAGKPIVVPSVDTVIDLAILYPHTAMISGTVTSAATGAPIQSVQVSWRRASDGARLGEVSTNATGQWTLPEPDERSYLAFEHYSYISEAFDNQPLTCRWCPAPAGVTVFDPATLTTDRANVNASLALRPSIQGQVRQENGVGLSTSVYFYDSTGGHVGHAWSDNEGKFTWRPEKAGTYFASASAWIGNSYLQIVYKDLRCTGSCPVTSGTPIQVAASATVSGIDIVFPNRPEVTRTTLTGVVYDDETGKPLAGVIVLAATSTSTAWSWDSVTTDAEGRYTREVSPGYTYRVRAAKSGAAYYAQVYGGAACARHADCTPTSGTLVEVTEGSSTTVNIRLPRMSVTSLTPRLAPPSGGTRVAISGKNFAANPVVRFDTIPATVVSATPTELVVIAPVGSVGPAHVEVSAGDLKLLLPEAFAYVSSVMAGDINGDFRSDIFWRNTSTGANEAWLMDGRYAPTTRSYDLLGTAWAVQTLGDFNGDGTGDVLWRNTSTGANTLWLMRNGVPQYVTVASQTLAWRVVGSGDFDLDGKADIFWRNDGTGATQVWFGTGSAFRVAASGAAKTPWQPFAIGDVNGDGRADVLWHNPTSTEVAVWLMNGATQTARIFAKMPAPWRIASAGDTDADGLADILWRRDDTGDQTLWLMSGTTYVAKPLARVGTSWMPIGLSDMTGDGRADILWRNSSNGQPSVWVMNGATQVTVFTLPVRDSNWKPHIAR